MSEQMSPQERARQAAIRAALAELQAEYAAVLPGLVEALCAAGETACASGDVADLDQLKLLVHRLHGAAGSYGFKGVSAAAGELEALVVAHKQSKRPFDASLAHQVRAALADVRAASERELADLSAAAEAK